MVTLQSICCVLFVVVHITCAQEPCKTPNDWNGTCINLQECRPLMSLLSDPPISNERKDFLRRSQCRSDAGKPIVCCPTTLTADDLAVADKKCGVQVSDKIVGGEETSITDFPWMALLHYKNSLGRGSFFCGGALIHEYYVITAGHCINGEDIARNGYVVDSVRLGEHDLRNNDQDCQENDCADPVQDIPVSETIVHESYAPTSKSQANDIALIRLQRAAPYSDFIRPVCLPIRDFRDRNFDEMPLLVAGFGRTVNASQSDVKLKVQLNGFNLEQCKAIYQKGKINLSSKVLCAGGENGRDSCRGDSGGPLIADSNSDTDNNKKDGDNGNSDTDIVSYLVGVVSFGPRVCGTRGYPGDETLVLKNQPKQKHRAIQMTR